MALRKSALRARSVVGALERQERSRATLASRPMAWVERFVGHAHCAGIDSKTKRSFGKTQRWQSPRVDSVRLRGG